ncbi:6888_t:CDS:1, partial [Ambispora gerdemannii]
LSIGSKDEPAESLLLLQRYIIVVDVNELATHEEVYVCHNKKK